MEVIDSDEKDRPNDFELPGVIGAYHLQPSSPLYYEIATITFTAYTEKEILKLSVKEITNPLSFDRTNRPVPGGLYDSLLGPIDQDDICAFCALPYAYCPGHWGHITLPMPVYNPVFFQLLLQILRGACIECHHFLFDRSFFDLFRLQLEAVSRDRLDIYYELEQVFSSLKDSKEYGGSNESSKISYVGITIGEKLQSFFNSKLSDGDSSEKLRSADRMLIGYRQQLYKTFIRRVLLRHVTACPHCKTPVRALKGESCSRIYALQVKSKKVLRKFLQQQSIVQRNSDVEALKPGIKKEQANDDGLSDLSGDDDDDNLGRFERTSGPADFPEQLFITALDAKKIIDGLWNNDREALVTLFRVLKDESVSSPSDVFFIRILPVPPNKLRPPARVGHNMFENWQSKGLSSVLRNRSDLLTLLQGGKLAGSENQGSNDQSNTTKPSPEKHRVVAAVWNSMQTNVNAIVDSALNRLAKSDTGKKQGIKQLLERKQGLFRMHLMGKRVDFAARSVITPDPNIPVDSVGVPEVFAKKLTFPQPVTEYNYEHLRKLVMNGPENYPGASFVITEDNQKIVLTKDPSQRLAIAETLLCRHPLAGFTPHPMAPKIVLRHLQNGDALLVNRQPTLHKPSIQAYKARIMPGQRTIRMHYSCCKAFNADFDGDEMNLHFPQNEVARSEAYNIVGAKYQYLVPKDGTPLGGLIHDHVVSAVLLTLRDRFLDKSTYQELLAKAVGDGLAKKRIRLLPPAIIKPAPMWTGKQVISSLLLTITPSTSAPINLSDTAKIPARSWVGDLSKEDKKYTSLMNDSEVVFRHGELLQGVVDKTNCGAVAYGLINAFYELYGGDVMCALLTSFGRLFTAFLQRVGFTVGVADLCLDATAEKKRAKIIRKSQNIGKQVVCEALQLGEASDVSMDDVSDAVLAAQFDSIEMLNSIAATGSAPARSYRLRLIDSGFKSAVSKVQDAITTASFPIGLMKPFPDNSLQLMVQSGSKGSLVNTMQMSCLLGQVELEGNRPQLMVSGRTLPSFAEYDMSPRAGGFVSDRFLTGIRPQEYFFHCMAGREGLVDTAVKTSRSGYLQRCVVKHLEGVSVAYDNTVRDSDKSVVQFLYGEDGLDIQKLPYLRPKMMPFLRDNYKANRAKLVDELNIDPKIDKKVNDYWKTVDQWRDKYGDPVSAKVKFDRDCAFLRFCRRHANTDRPDLDGGRSSRSMHTLAMIESWVGLTQSERDVYAKQARQHCPEPALSALSPVLPGCVSENFKSLIDSFNEETRVDRRRHLWASPKDFSRVAMLKYRRSLAHPGEAVGVLCAQSIGEPSTQMTLNTFHFAGRGEMNVTLGIPRLREIIMTASAKIGTPMMTIPIHPDRNADVTKLARRLTRIYAANVLERASIVERIRSSNVPTPVREYLLTFTLMPSAAICQLTPFRNNQIIRLFENILFRHLALALTKKMQEVGRMMNVDWTKARTERKVDNDGEDEDKPRKKTSDDVGESEARRAERRQDECDYGGEKEERKEAGLEEDAADAALDNDEEAAYLEAMEPGDDRESDNENSGEDSESIRGIPTAADENRKVNALRHSSYFTDYSFDQAKSKWCCLTMQIPLDQPELDVVTLVGDTCRRSLIHQIPGIVRAQVDTRKGLLQVEGINLNEIWKNSEALDISKLYTNDIQAFAGTYGIEAARALVMSEVARVFRDYGIEVGYHHLSLLSDYMTRDGVVTALNRYGMEANPSAFQKMSFETSLSFLKAAVIAGEQDAAQSPSTRIAFGLPVKLGTGSFNILYDMDKRRGGSC